MKVTNPPTFPSRVPPPLPPKQPAKTPPPIPPAAKSTPPTAISPLQRSNMFGHFEWMPAPNAGNKERIIIKGRWVAENIVSVNIPQLQTLGLYPIVKFHRLAEQQLTDLFTAWEGAGLLSRIKTWNGSFVPRFKRGRAGGGLADLSNHSWGTAFDINTRWNRLGETPAPLGAEGSVVELEALANEHGFVWGGRFKGGRADGMHFEVFKIIG